MSCPVGTGIIFADFNGSGDIWNVQPDGSGLTQLTSSGDDQASWSPDVKQLAIWRGNDIVLACSDGSSPTTLLAGAGSVWPGSRPRWTSDGGEIYVPYSTTSGANLGAGIVEINADGSGSTPIPITVPNITGWSNGYVDASVDAAFVGPSPDSTMLAFAVVYTSPTVSNPFLAVCAIDGTGVTVLTAINGGNPGVYAQAWYKDNAHILAQFTVTGPTGTDIAKVNIADTDVILHSDSGSGDAFRGCALSPDESQVAFCGPNPGDLVVMPAAGGALTTVLAYDVLHGQKQPGSIDWRTAPVIPPSTVLLEPGSAAPTSISSGTVRYRMGK